MKNETPKGWYSRGYLPHLDDGLKTQFVTCRLFDSLPQKILIKLRAEIESKDVENIDRELMISIENFLDSGYGECFLKARNVAETIKDSLKTFDGERYKLIA